MDTVETRELILKESVEALIHHYALVSANISFPEMILPTQIMLERFKKNTNQRKQVQVLLDLLRRNEE